MTVLRSNVSMEELASILWRITSATVYQVPTKAVECSKYVVYFDQLSGALKHFFGLFRVCHRSFFAALKHTLTTSSSLSLSLSLSLSHTHTHPPTHPHTHTHTHTHIPSHSTWHKKYFVIICTHILAPDSYTTFINTSHKHITMCSDLIHTKAHSLSLSLAFFLSNSFVFSSLPTWKIFLFWPPPP